MNCFKSRNIFVLNYRIFLSCFVFLFMIRKKRKKILIINRFAGGLFMSLLIGGVISAVIGLVSLIFWWGGFMTIVKGAFPICLLLGVALAVYVGIDEIQEKKRAQENN